MSLTAPERETVITLNDEDGHACIYTAQRPVITKLKKNPAATLIEEGKFDGSVWARFELPKGLISYRSTRATQTLSEEERERRREHLAAVRARRG